MPILENLPRMLSPRSIAIVGASDDPHRIGGRPLALMRERGFPGSIYPINPKRSRVQGMKAYSSLADLPEPVDLAIVAVSADQVLDALEAGAGLVRSYVLLTAGFKEVGPAGADLERKVLDAALRSHALVLGPNCLGFVNGKALVYATFSAGFEDIAVPADGGLALVTQSGAFGAYLFRLALQRRLEASSWVSTGNEMMVSVADVIDAYIESPTVRCVLGYLEGVKDPSALEAVLRRVDACGKLLIVVKAGRTQAGAGAVASHTGAMVGSDQAFDALLRGHRAVRAESIDDMLDLAWAAQCGFSPTGSRLGIVTMSGGAGILMADFAQSAGLSLPEVPPQARVMLKERVPFAVPHNPLDVTAQIVNDPGVLETALRSIMRDDAFDVVLVFLSHLLAAPSTGPGLLRVLQDAIGESHIPLAVVGSISREVQHELQLWGVPCFADPAAAVATVAQMVRLQNGPRFADTVGSTPPLGHPFPARRLEYDIKRWLGAVGLPVPDGRLVADAEAAQAEARTLGFPVALKLQSADLEHKSDAGGVAVGLTSESDVASASRRMMGSAKALRLREPLLLVERMAPPGVELIVSVQLDPVFGSLLTFGLGGVFVEIFRDVCTDFAGIGPERVRWDLQSLRAWPVLAGARGARRVDVDALAAMISRIGIVGRQLIEAGEIRQLELNPVRIGEAGPMILDAVAYS